MPGVMDRIRMTRSTATTAVLTIPRRHVSAHVLAMYDMRYVPRVETDEYACTDCPCGWFRWEPRGVS